MSRCGSAKRCAATQTQSRLKGNPIPSPSIKQNTNFISTSTYFGESKPAFETTPKQRVRLEAAKKARGKNRIDRRVPITIN